MRNFKSHPPNVKANALSSGENESNKEQTDLLAYVRSSGEVVGKSIFGARSRGNASEQMLRGPHCPAGREASMPKEQFPSTSAYREDSQLGKILRLRCLRWQRNASALGWERRDE